MPSRVDHMVRPVLVVCAVLAFSSAPSANAATVQVAPSGKAVLEGRAPAALKRLVSAANRIALKPYRYGGGHGTFTDTAYDCSGSTSYALHGAGKLSRTLTSRDFMKYGRPGPGRFVSVYAKPGWVLLVVGGVRFDVAGLDEVGSRWWDARPPDEGFTVRHPPGL
jgi:hypothetical protein